MKAVHIILSNLYLLLMVLLPYLHLPFHEVAEQAAVHSACHFHTAAPETGPEEAEPHHDGHEDCSLCELLLIPADLPQIICRADAALELTREVPVSPEPAAAYISAGHQARAPPFMTV